MRKRIANQPRYPAGWFPDTRTVRDTRLSGSGSGGVSICMRAALFTHPNPADTIPAGPVQRESLRRVSLAANKLHHRSEGRGKIAVEISVIPIDVLIVAPIAEMPDQPMVIETAQTIH